MNWFIDKRFGDRTYRVSKPLVYLTIILLSTLVVLGFAENDWSLESKYYVYCPDEEGCFNSMYNSVACVGSKFENTALCTQKYLPYNSSIGEKPSFIVANTNTITLIIVSLFLFFNTFLYNKEFFKNLKLEE
jgi:hypothetical protein